MSQKIIDTLQFVCQVLENFGINYMTPEMLRVGKFPNQSNEKIKENYWKLIFHLCILKMANFNYKINEEEIEILDLEKMNKFTLFFLQSIECPMVKKVEN